MRYLSLFSGIEAASAAWAGLGWECAGVSEIEPYPCKVLAHHHPSVPNLGDVTKITEADIMLLGQIDLVVFGSPCQDLSVAGKRKGLDGARSGLFFTALRIVGWARKWGGCRFALWENVLGAFSSNKGRDFAAVVDALAGVDGTPVPPKGWGTEGCALGDEAMVEWSTLDAQWFGVAQKRRRVFALADFGDWTNRPPILLEPQGMRGDTAPRRETREDVAGTLTASAGKRCGVSDPDRGQLVRGPLLSQAFGGNNTSGPIDVATARNACASASASGRLDFESETFLVTSEEVSPTLMSGSTSPAAHGKKNGTDREALVVCITGDVAHTLKADGFDASEDGTGRGTPIIPVAGVEPWPGFAQDVAFIRATRPVCYDTTQVTSVANRSNPQPGDPCHPPLLIPSYSTKLHNTTSNQSGKIYEEYTVSLDRSSPPPALLTPTQVRCLTPRECERLQGFPDDHTAISVRGKPAADGPRYKALGNSMAVPVMRWIGQQIDAAVLW
jgi:DNA (cytosine-5)-methyltransferase 1